MPGRGMTQSFCWVAVVGFITCSWASEVKAGPAPVARVMCDSNGDSRRDLSDAVYLFSWLFLGGNEPVSLEPLAGPSTLLNGDCNGDKTRNISDGIYLLAWLFLGGPDPKEGVPGPTARADIGAEGGSLTSPDGTLTLTIPAGALGETTEITITEVPADQVPDHLKAIEADRIFQLGPDGHQFAQPVTAEVSLAAGNQLAVMLLETDGTIEYAAAQQVEIRTDGRFLSGQLMHFTHVVAKTIGSYTLELTVDKRELKEGEKVTAVTTLSKTAFESGENEERLEAYCNLRPGFLPGDPPICESEVLLPDTEFDFCDGCRFERREAGECTTTQFWTCKKPGPALISVTFTVTIWIPPPHDVFEAGGQILHTTVAIDVVCKKDDSGDEILTGVKTLPFDMTNPDGVTVFPGAFANLVGAGPFAAIAGQNGMVVMDLTTGLSALDQTFNGPDGPLGTNLLGGQPISLPNPGPGTPAALFGTSTNGGNLRNFINGWGPTQVSLQACIDAANGGGRIDAQEMVIVVPTRGLHFVKYVEEGEFFNFDSSLSIPRAQFSGDLRSAVLPLDEPGSPVLDLSANTDGGTTSTVSVHLRDPSQPAVKLFSFPDPDGRRLRCLAEDELPEELGGLIPCIATGYSTGTASYFLYDPANPTAVPQVQTLAAGAGALGVQFGLRADGNPWAVVSNFTAGSFTVIPIDARGVVTGSETETVPLQDGCKDSAHAVPFSHKGKDYVFGTCFGTDKYFGLNIRF